MLIPIFDWAPAARAPFELYLRGIGIPIKYVKAKSVTEMKQCLTGRDAEVVVAKALMHIPELLAFVHAGEQEVVDEVADARKPTQPQATRTSRLGRRRGGGRRRRRYLAGRRVERASGRARVGLLRRPLLRHASFQAGRSRLSPEARRRVLQRGGQEVVAAHKQLNPTAQSACPHVALCVVTRQMVADGDPGRRGADHSESFGAQNDQRRHPPARASSVRQRSSTSGAWWVPTAPARLGDVETARCLACDAGVPRHHRARADPARR